jgi:hypothetical protein
MKPLCLLVSSPTELQANYYRTLQGILFEINMGAMAPTEMVHLTAT